MRMEWLLLRQLCRILECPQKKQKNAYKRIDEFCLLWYNFRMLNEKLLNKKEVMVTMDRKDNPYTITYNVHPIYEIANAIKYLPRTMMNKEGNNVTQEFIDYILPLCKGTEEVKEKNGLPIYSDKSKF